MFNMDLFGEGIDSKEATRKMCILRQFSQLEGMFQLMFARPEANLDYNSREGFTYHDNHPLGNWCEFYRVGDGGLISCAGPIKHGG